jgi:hypothetical protein
MEEQTQPMRDLAVDALEAAKQQGRQAKDSLEQGARDAIRTATEKATEGADAVVGTVAREGKALANALRSAADQAEREGARSVQGPLRSAASMFDRWLERAEGQGIQQWASGFESFGRREPLALFGAAAALGFLGTRALRAGVQARSEAASQERRSDEPTDMTMSFGQDEAGRLPREATPVDNAPEGAKY